MEALKIVSQLDDKSDSITLFDVFNNVTVRRGIWGSEKNGATRALINGVLCVPNYLIPKDSNTVKDGDKCKFVLLDKPGGLVSIATDATVYILGNNGDTIDTIY